MNAPLTPAQLKLVRIGNSTGVVLPRQMLASLGVGVGDTVTAAATGEGELTLRRSDDEFERQMAAAREVMARRTRALRELAK